MWHLLIKHFLGLSACDGESAGQKMCWDSGRSLFHVVVGQQRRCYLKPGNSVSKYVVFARNMLRHKHDIVLDEGENEGTDKTHN